MDKRNSFLRSAVKSILVLSCLWIQTPGQLLVPAISSGKTALPTTRPSLTQSSCNYLISNTNGVCMVSTTAVEKHLNALKEENFRARLQYLSQNSVLQTQIAELESDDLKLSLRLDGLQRDLRALRSRVTTTGTIGVYNIKQVRTSLQQSIQKVDDKLNDLTAAYQRDAVSQAQTNAAFQLQLTTLVQDNQQLTATNNQLSQGLQRLTTQVQALSTQCTAGCGAASNTGPTTATTPTTTASATATPPTTATPFNSSRIAKIERDILNLENLLQQTNADLGILDRLVTVNQTQQIRNAALELRAHDQRIRGNQRDTDRNYQALIILNNTTLPELRTSINSTLNDSKALKTLTSQLQAGQRILLNDTVFTKLDVGKLQKDMLATQTAQGRHRKAIDELNTNLINPLKATYSKLSAVQSNVVTILNGGTPGSSTAAPTSTTKGTIFVPPTLNPPASGPVFIVPPALPPGSG